MHHLISNHSIKQTMKNKIHSKRETEIIKHENTIMMFIAQAQNKIRR